MEGSLGMPHVRLAAQSFAAGSRRYCPCEVGQVLRWGSQAWWTWFLIFGVLLGYAVVIGSAVYYAKKVAYLMRGERLAPAVLLSSIPATLWWLEGSGGHSIRGGRFCAPWQRVSLWLRSGEVLRDQRLTCLEPVPSLRLEVEMVRFGSTSSREGSEPLNP